ncbi:UTRA domain-containing protein [Actinoalloteichus sp. GBA129-24]|uniref:UTRA domain-containing protein n=1 Tax=Actinoalloteichus fjordicus TaxID=1612552 RepID=A0AAC9PTE5_9PSEU|nr:UTRA domain-containing protein [Actinoalloteichus fjordicus]APU22645.1 UTRA domain-containing protein [Actinoalloteichus sp. GBA129-24]
MRRDHQTEVRAIVDTIHSGEFRPIRRVSPDRLRSAVWSSGQPIWSTDENRHQVVAAVATSRETPPAHVAHVLGLSEDRQVWVRRRRFLVDDEPVQLATSYFPADLVDGSTITEADTGPGGSYARLRDLGHEPVRFREELRARVPDSEEAAALGLTQGTPVIVIVRTAYTDADQAVEVNEMTLDANAYIVEYRFSAQD